MFNPDSNTVVEARILHESANGNLMRDRSDGLPRSGTAVEVSFIEPDSTIGRGLLPTGRAVDLLPAGDGRGIEVSIVDSGAVYLFVRASDMPFDPGRTAELLRVAEHLRSQAAVTIGLAGTPEDARRLTPNVPKVAFVSPASEAAADAHIFARIVSSQSLHRAYAVTGAIATIAAAVIPDSIVNRFVGNGRLSSPVSLRIAHPGGVIEPRVEWRSTANGIAIDRACILRTARRLMQGLLYPPSS